MNSITLLICNVYSTRHKKRKNLKAFHICAKYLFDTC